MKTEKIYIRNEWVEGAGTREVVNPATGETLAVVTEASREDVERAVAAAREAFDSGPWRRSTALERGRLLFRMAEVVKRHAAELAELETRNTGKPIV